MGYFSYDNDMFLDLCIDTIYRCICKMNVTTICENVTRFYYDGKPILEPVCITDTTLNLPDIMLIILAAYILLVVFMYYVKTTNKDETKE